MSVELNYKDERVGSIVLRDALRHAAMAMATKLRMDLTEDEERWLTGERAK